MREFAWFCAGVAVGPTIHILVRLIVKIIVNAWKASRGEQQ
jgi:hypothetical protein